MFPLLCRHSFVILSLLFAYEQDIKFSPFSFSLHDARRPALPSLIEVVAFTNKVSKFVQNNPEIIGKIAKSHAEVYVY